jgi:POT family proton-dependent oligopeptide transporter
MSVPASSAPGPFERRFGHPPGLAVLFLTEMWERFSFYGMRGLLVLYMVRHLFLADRAGQVAGFGIVKGALEAIFGPLAVQPLASQVYGLYTGLVYLTPFFGGMLADRVLGQRRTVVVGGVLMAIGHFLMASERLFFVALLFLIAGNGCFKPNVSTQVGALYPPGDPRRDRAFGLFYMGINLGAFLANLVCATLAAAYGWHWGFGAAGVGMIVGLAVYLGGQRHLAPDEVTRRRAGGTSTDRAPFTPDEWRRIWALVALCALNVVFWAAYEQQGNTMQLWADEQTVWPTFFGWQVPSPWYQSFNPFVIFLFTPLLALLWGRQASRRTEPSSVAKMAIGCLLLGLSFVLMAAGARIVGGGRGSLFWPLATTFILTIGELYLSPIGLSLVTKVAPARVVSMMMGVWFLSSFFGNYLSGYVGTFYGPMPREGFFLLLAALGVGAGLAILAFNRPLKRALGGGA